MFNLPGVVLGLFAVMALVHGLRDFVLTEEQDAWTLLTFAFVPGRFTLLFDPAGVSDALAGLTGPQAGLRQQVGQFFLGDGRAQWWTLLTYAFLHANWTHLAVNSLWLAAFGAPVARRFGASRFLVFFAVTAVAGALAHLLVHRFDVTPVIGASASVSGLTAAAIRFVFQPHAPLGLGLRAGRADDETAAYLQPALPLGQILSDRRVLPFLLVWFAVNFVFGASSEPLGLTSGPVAWEAHAGGFLAGLLLFALFDPVRRRS
jgi:membrane associated rhomboid family serine protease